MKDKRTKDATTISLPKETLNTVNKEKSIRHLQSYSNQKIILLCLRKYLKLYQPEDFDSRSTCRYNRETCSNQLKIKLTPMEHHNLKMHRLMLQQSASYLCFLAIEQFLIEILELLKASSGKDCDSAIAKISILQEGINTIHRKFSFRAKNMCRLVGMMASDLPSCLIVIPRISRTRSPPILSGHKGRPYSRRPPI